MSSLCHQSKMFHHLQPLCLHKLEHLQVKQTTIYIIRRLFYYTPIMYKPNRLARVADSQCVHTQWTTFSLPVHHKGNNNPLKKADFSFQPQKERRGDHPMIRRSIRMYRAHIRCRESASSFRLRRMITDPGCTMRNSIR